jgi:cytochrome c peroxidase
LSILCSYDDGSYGPVLLRLAWHSSGTFSEKDHSGGSNGGTMRFKAESSHAANNGLQIARDLLEEKIKSKYPDISYGDLYTLGGVVAVQELVSYLINGWGRMDIDLYICM